MRQQAIVESLGWTPVKGTSWHAASRLEVGVDGIEQDRRWTPITRDLRAVKATDVPQLAGLRVEPAQLPGVGEDLVFPRPRTVRYYHRPFTAWVHDGPLARRIGAVVGEPVWLAHTTGPAGFIWSSPVSLLLRSELAHPTEPLPDDTARYRPNIVLNDREAPLSLRPGARIELPDGVLLEAERELDRCLVINHHPVTGARDANLLKRLRPGVLLGWGCRVLRPGTVHTTTG
ncbi:MULTISPECIES: MOSC domain-containing protein [unclassified Luteococcus]|uniref:MOSC domain-containing protein n=1 Tax=unclassified Luteococcus TaxID=2639923 RepID=UPI00313CE514